MLEYFGSLFWYHYLGIYFVGLLIFFLVSGLTDRLGAGELNSDTGPIPEVAVILWPFTLGVGLPIAFVVGAAYGAFRLGEKIKTIRITVDDSRDDNRDIL